MGTLLRQMTVQSAASVILVVIVPGVPAIKAIYNTASVLVAVGWSDKDQEKV